MKEKPKNWPHQILDFLYQHYSEAETELNRFLYEKLHLEKSNTTHKDKIKDILDKLKDKGYLIWKANKVKINDDGSEQVIADMTEDFHNVPHLGLKDARIEAQLTIEGLEHAIELRREKQKHKIFVIATPLGSLFALVAAIMSIANYKGCQSEPERQKQVIIVSPEQTKESKEPTKQPVETQRPLQSPEKK